jgi:hypothetical protein
MKKHKKRKPNPPRPQKRRSRQAKVNITKEVNYIIQCAQNGDGRAVAVGQFVFFSTATGDAWLLEPGEQLAMELARDREEQAFTILETPHNVAIKWELAYEIQGGSFITISEKGRITTIQGYPIDEIQEMIKLTRQ